MPEVTKVLCSAFFLTQVLIPSAGAGNIELTQYYGRYESEVENCTKIAQDRQRGNYLYIGVPWDKGNIASVRRGDYETEGGGCSIYGASKSGNGLFLNAGCGEEDFGSTPAQLQVERTLNDTAIVYEERQGTHVSNGIYYWCNKQPNYSMAKFDADELKNIGSSAQKKGREIAALRAQERADEPEMNGGNWRRPFKCSYSRRGKVVSESVCHADRVRNPITWTWENGNIVVVHEDDGIFKNGKGQGKWNGKRARETYKDDVHCFHLKRTKERFCVRETQ